MAKYSGIILFWVLGLILITWMPPLGDYAMRVFYLFILFLILEISATVGAAVTIIQRLYMIACTIALFVSARDAQNEIITRRTYPRELSEAMNTPQMDMIRTCLRAMGNDGIAFLNPNGEKKGEPKE